MHFARYAKGAIALSLATPILGGCWYSNEPLIVSATSANPVEAGDYWFHPSGESEPSQVTLMPIPGGGYIYAAEDEVLALMLHEIEDDWYALQLTGESGPAVLSVGHVVNYQDDRNGVKINKRRVDYYDPPCDEALVALEGVISDSEDCEFSSLESLVAAGKLLAARLGSGEHFERSSWSELEEEPAIEE